MVITSSSCFLPVCQNMMVSLSVYWNRRAWRRQRCFGNRRCLSAVCVLLPAAFFSLLNLSPGNSVKAVAKFLSLTGVLSFVLKDLILQYLVSWQFFQYLYQGIEKANSLAPEPFLNFLSEAYVCLVLSLCVCCMGMAGLF